jgi:hypothetical protein
MADKARGGAGIVAKGAAAATVGAAAAALAGRAVIHSRTRRKRVLGVQMPRRRKGMTAVAKQFADMAGEIEKQSAKVNKASGRAKEAAKILA